MTGNEIALCINRDDAESLLILIAAGRAQMGAQIAQVALQDSLASLDAVSTAKGFFAAAVRVEKAIEKGMNAKAVGAVDQPE